MMLQKISKVLTGDMLKVLCDMGHGDMLILADANFPGESIAKTTSIGNLIRCPGADVATLYEAIHELFPLDAEYSGRTAAVMDLTDSDKAKGSPEPEAWGDYEAILHKDYPDVEMEKIERFAFYEQAKHAYCVIQTGEERKYGNLMLVKGCVL